MAHLRALSGIRDFRLLWIGETISELGSAMSTFVFPLLAYAVTGSAAAAAVAQFASILGMVAMLLPAGVLADRVDRRKVLMTASAVGLIAYAGLALAIYRDVATLPLITAIAGVTGICAGVVGPTQMSVTRDLVPTDLLPAAMSQSQARQHLGDLLGGPVGGVLFGITSWLTFAVDSATYVASLVCVFAIRTDLSPPERKKQKVLADLREGLAFVVSRPYFRHSIALSFIINIAVNAAFFAAIIRLARDGYSAAAIGIVGTVFGLSALAGAVLAPRIVDRFPTGRLIMTYLWGWPLLAIPLYSSHNPVTTGLCLAAGIFLNPSVVASASSYRMHITPPALQGRMVSSVMFVFGLGMPVAPLLGGALLEHTTDLITFGTLGLLAMVSAVIATASRPVRTVPRPEEWRAPSYSG